MNDESGRAPLICLTGIFKNEAKSIVQTLESAIKAGAVDCWAICDTGSTDGTQDLIESTLAGIPGTLYHPPFIDFSTTRNFALDRARDSGARFSIMLSGDETIEGPIDRAMLEASDCTAHDVQVNFGDFLYYRTVRVVSCAPESDWRYEGVTHEALVTPKGHPVGPIAGHVKMNPPPPEEKRARFEQDRDLLEAEIAARPDNARAMFYLAQTYACLGLQQLAFDMYIRRANVDGWKEEKFEALLRAGGIAIDCGGSQANIEKILFTAHLMSPHRAEPLYHLARYYRKFDRWESVYHFASEALRRPFPEEDRLFIDKQVYDWKATDERAVAAYYLERFEEAEALFTKLLQGTALPASERARVENNLAHCYEDDEALNPPARAS